MNIFLYQDRKKNHQDWCEVCSDVVGQDNLDPHHIYRKRYGDECIWVCRKCHQKIENPTAFGLSSSWAYDNGYLVRRGKGGTKKKKDKKCKHGAYLYSEELGCEICQFCKKPVKRVEKKQKKEKVYKKKDKKCNCVPIYSSEKDCMICQFCKKLVTSFDIGKKKKVKTKSASPPKGKMGYEQQDPRIIKAEKFLKEWKKNPRTITKEKYEDLKKTMGKINKQTIPKNINREKKRGNIANLTPFTSDYQPSPEAKKKGQRKYWDIEKTKRNIIDAFSQFSELNFKDIKELTEKIANQDYTNKDGKEMTVTQVKAINYIMNSKLDVDFMNRGLEYAKQQIEHTGNLELTQILKDLDGQSASLSRDQKETKG